MKVYLVTPSGERRDVVDPYRVNQVVADGACPACHAAPFKVRWEKQRYLAKDQAYQADGISACCEQPVGVLRAEPEPQRACG